MKVFLKRIFVKDGLLWLKDIDGSFEHYQVVKAPLFFKVEEISNNPNEGLGVYYTYLFFMPAINRKLFSLSEGSLMKTGFPFICRGYFHEDEHRTSKSIFEIKRFSF